MPHNDMIYTNWFAIDGAPCSGKTVLVNALAQKMGWNFCPDYAREIFSQAMQEGITHQDIQDNQPHYQDLIASKRLDFIRNSNPNEIIMHDYGLPSDIAWHEEKEAPLPYDIEQACSQYRYRRVFILDMVANYPDEIRKETNSDRIRIHRRLWDTYQSLGYTPIRVPSFRAPNEKIAIMQRMDFLLGEIQSLIRTSAKPKHTAIERA